MFPDAARFYHVNKRLLQHGTTTVESLVHTDSSMILLQGSGGTGKTFMLHTAALNWARDLLWQDVSYVLLFTFRRLNLMNATSFHELLHLEYPFLFENATFEELFSSKHKVVILLDGMDEFANLEDIQHMVDGVRLPTDDGKKGVSNALFDVMNPNSRLIPKKTVIVTSRPITAKKLMVAARQYLEWSQLQVYDVLGFGERQVNEFIDHFNNGNAKRATKIKSILRKSDNLMLMSRIPVYLRGLCEIYQNEEFSDDLSSARTTNEIFIGQLAMYLHKHYRERSHQQVKLPMMDIFKIEKVQSTIKRIAELAKVALLHESIYVSLSKTNITSLDEIEISGLISVIKTPVEVKLEFNHLLLQEFLTALHYLTQNQTIVNKELFSQPQLEGCLHLYAGFQGALLKETRSPELIVQFLENLHLRHQKVKSNQLVIHHLIEVKRGDLLADTMFEYHNEILVNTTKTNDVEISFTSKSYFSNNFHLLLYFLHHHSQQFPNFQLSVWFDEINDEKFDSKYAVIAAHVCKSRELFVQRTKISTKKWNDFLESLYICRIQRKKNNESISRLLIHDIIVDSEIMMDYLIDIMSTYPKVEISNPLNSKFLRKLQQTLLKKNQRTVIKHLHLFTGAVNFSEVLANVIISIETVFIEHVTNKRYTQEEIENIVTQLNHTLQQTNPSNIKLRTLTIDNTWKLDIEIYKYNISHMTTWYRLTDGKEPRTEETTSVYFDMFIYCATNNGLLFPLSIICVLTMREHHKTKKIWVICVFFSATILLFGRYFETRQFELLVANNQMKFSFSDM